MRLRRTSRAASRTEDEDQGQLDASGPPNEDVDESIDVALDRDTDRDTDRAVGTFLEDDSDSDVDVDVDVDDDVDDAGSDEQLSDEATEARERSRFRERLGRARSGLFSPLSAIRGRSRIDEATFDDLEEALILADVGLPTTTALLGALRDAVRANQIDGDDLVGALRSEIIALFDGEDRSLHTGEVKPAVWLFVGVNGVGKTTTIAKLAKKQIDSGSRVVLAAGDTFRAAAADQLEEWAARIGASVVRGADGADPSSVVFDAVQHAAARGADLVLADSAGRLHTKVNLMEELAKIKRVAARPPGDLCEVLLVIDATTGQNGLTQARQFTEAIGVTGIVLTKLDGSAKGGIVLAIRSELGLPIKLVGLGESADDLVAFDPEEFADALLAP